ncbi:MAG: hypothetical protein A3E82_00540 [Gammaproteobacteria bacterium RIFCSPHIGHO2_12_FULL_38_11]|nr:MAG: hypothetical protein A3E82_00540 [Gammaproteobacteria bacterium RIFCSPHIGHO2_12_FULL_38_11]
MSRSTSSAFFISNNQKKEILNFYDVIEKIERSVGYKGAPESDQTLPYVGEKPGGSDVGHIVLMNDGGYIVKTGVTLSLLGQALKKFVEKRPDKERLYLSFIVGNFTRIVGDETADRQQLADKLGQKHGKTYENITQKEITELLTSEILTTLNQFKETVAGKAILEKLNENTLNTNEIYNIYHYIVTQNEILRDVIGLAAFADLVNGACGQFFNNDFQKRSTPSAMLDDHRLLLESNGSKATYMASRFNTTAEPFDKFLLEPFRTNKRDNFENTEAWIRQCQQDLSNKILNIQGLCSAILIRHIMGESADLGPDNMLIALNNDIQHIINIDVTGFRYPRRNGFHDPRKNETRLGWEDTLKTDNPNDIMNFLFDKTVFSDRFVSDASDIDKTLKKNVIDAIMETLKSKIDPKNAYKEVLAVRQWLQQQSSEFVVSSLNNAITEAYNALNPIVKPQRYYLEKVLKYNERFIQDSIQVAKESLELQQELTVPSF